MLSRILKTIFFNFLCVFAVPLFAANYLPENGFLFALGFFLYFFLFTYYEHSRDFNVSNPEEYCAMKSQTSAVFSRIPFSEGSRTKIPLSLSSQGHPARSRRAINFRCSLSPNKLIVKYSKPTASGGFGGAPIPFHVFCPMWWWQPPAERNFAEFM